MVKVGSGFEQLTWEELTTWAGTKILSRGKSCKRQVDDLRLAKDGRIVAWVYGTRKYATAIRRDSAGALSAVCSCPYAWTPCKHSVAVVLAYLDAVKNKQDVPEVSEGDRRLELFKESSCQEDADIRAPENEDAEIDLDLRDSEPGAEDTDSVSASGSCSASRKRSKRADVVRKRIESMDKDRLVEFVINLVQEYPEIGRKIEEEEELKAGRVTNIVSSIRAEIEQLTSEPAWYNHWSREGNLPDYSRVRERLQSLLDSGHVDEVVDLGKYLWRLGNEQVASSDDEGKTGSQISECMVIVMQAVSRCSLSIRDRILWIIDTCLSDEYGLLAHSENYLEGWQDTTAWNEVADSLQGRLEDTNKDRKKSDASTDSRDWRRREIMYWTIDALKRCGRDKDIIPLLEREAPITRCYGTLVDYLLHEGRRTEAKMVAIDGFQQTIDAAPGVAWDLEAKLRTMAEQDEDLPLVATYRMLELFHRPSLDSYKMLKKAAQAVNQWPAVREAAIRFLETGCRPDLQGTDANGKTASESKCPWPLPGTEIPTIPEKTRHLFPDTSTLIRIAIHEKDNDTVIRRHNAAKNTRFFGNSIDDEVAEAVKKTHPDVSLQIWRNAAEQQIKLVKPAAYSVAARYLIKMRDVYQDTRRKSEWTALIADIRVAHKAKRSLIQILDTLEAKRIIDT